MPTAYELDHWHARYPEYLVFIVVANKDGQSYETYNEDIDEVKTTKPSYKTTKENIKVAGFPADKNIFKPMVAAGLKIALIDSVNYKKETIGLFR